MSSVYFMKEINWQSLEDISVDGWDWDGMQIKESWQAFTNQPISLLAITWLRRKPGRQRREVWRSARSRRVIPGPAFLPGNRQPIGGHPILISQGDFVSYHCANSVTVSSWLVEAWLARPVMGESEIRGSHLQWGNFKGQKFDGCPILSHSIGQEKLRTVFVFEIGHLEGPHVAFAGHNSKFK